MNVVQVFYGLVFYGLSSSMSRCCLYKQLHIQMRNPKFLQSVLKGTHTYRAMEKKVPFDPARLFQCFLSLLSPYTFFGTTLHWSLLRTRSAVVVFWLWKYSCQIQVASSLTLLVYFLIHDSRVFLRVQYTIVSSFFLYSLLPLTATKVMRISL